MKVIFGGVRGSMPVTGEQYAVYGGDTTSLLVLGASGERIVIDAGTGLSHLLPHLGEANDPLVLLLTHYHLDHLMGFASFPPLYQKERSIRIVGMIPPAGHPDTWQALTTLMGEPFWPIQLNDAGAALVIHDVSWRDGSWKNDPNRDCLAVGSLEVRACPVAHPGGCLAWRIDEPSTGGSMILATDMEWGQAGLEQRKSFLKFCRTPRPVTTLIMDGHFLDENYSLHQGWGHSTLQQVAEVGVEAGASQIVATHHDPDLDDQALDERADRLVALVREKGSDARAFLARQDQEVECLGQKNPEEDAHQNARNVLLMVGELHKMGYERLRVGPGISPSGVYWRCAVTHVANVSSDNGALVLDKNQDTAQYSSGSGENYFGWEDTSGDTPEDLARKFVERFPVIARLGRGDDDDYVQWFEQVIRLARDGDLPYAYSDWTEKNEAGLLPTVGNTTPLPMPPGGEG